MVSGISFSAHTVLSIEAANSIPDIPAAPFCLSSGVCGAWSVARQSIDPYTFYERLHITLAPERRVYLIIAIIAENVMRRNFACEVQSAVSRFFYGSKRFAAADMSYMEVASDFAQKPYIAINRVSLGLAVGTDYKPILGRSS